MSSRLACSSERTRTAARRCARAIVCVRVLPCATGQFGDTFQDRRMQDASCSVWWNGGTRASYFCRCGSHGTHRGNRRESSASQCRTLGFWQQTLAPTADRRHPTASSILIVLVELCSFPGKRSRGTVGGHGSRATWRPWKAAWNTVLKGGWERTWIGAGGQLALEVVRSLNVTHIARSVAHNNALAIPFTTCLRQLAACGYIDRAFECLLVDGCHNCQPLFLENEQGICISLIKPVCVGVFIYFIPLPALVGSFPF